jgi:hypothetical protein
MFEPAKYISKFEIIHTLETDDFYSGWEKIRSRSAPLWTSPLYDCHEAERSVCVSVFKIESIKA